MFGLMPFENSNDSFRDMFRTLDRMERGFFGNNDSNVCQFRTDIQDEGDHYLLEAELPGFNKEDINVEAKNGVLTISAKREEKNDEKDEKSGQYIRRERRYGSFQRSFSLNGVDPKNIQGQYQDGVLKLTLPKEQPAVPETHRIEIR